MKIWTTASCLLLLSFAQAQSSGQTDTATEQPKTVKVFNFKSDTDTGNAKGSAQYSFEVEEKPNAPLEANGIDIKSATYVKNFIGYPEREVFVSFDPTDYAGKFTYSGVSFNYNSSTAAAGEVGFRESFTPDTIVSVVATFFNASTDAGTPGHFIVNASKVSMYDVTARGNFCIGDNFKYFTKLCPGFDLGISAYPVLGFTNQTTLELQQAKEIMIGPNFFMQMPLIYDVHWDNLFTLDFGTGVGQSGSLSSTKNIAYSINSSIAWPIQHRYNLNVGVNYLARQATIQGSNGAVTDRWDTTLGELSGRVAVGYLW